MKRMTFGLSQRTRLLALTLAMPATMLAYSGMAQAAPHHDDHRGGPAHADEHRIDHPGKHDSGRRPDSHHDDRRREVWHRVEPPRFRPRVGVTIDVLPPAPRVVIRGRDRFYFSSGAWYRPAGPRFVVVAPPIGLVIPFLPDYSDTRVVRGETYYIAGDTYYRATPRGDGYIVTAPPEDAADAGTPSDKMFIYPRNGQSQKQQDADRYECHAWAMDQSGFDPTQAHGGVSADQYDERSDDYQRATQACLEGRGYTVK